MSKHTPTADAPHVGDVAPPYDIPVRRPHVADGFSCVGGVAPTYDTPVGRPHAADGSSCVGGAAPTHSHACRIYLTCMLTASSLHT